MRKENKTIKKLEAYSQPIVKAYGFEAEKGFTGTGHITASAHPTTPVAPVTLNK